MGYNGGEVIGMNWKQALLGTMLRGALLSVLLVWVRPLWSQVYLPINLSGTGSMEWDWDSRDEGGGNGLPDIVSSYISGNFFGNSWEGVQSSFRASGEGAYIESVLDPTRKLDGNYSWRLKFNYLQANDNTARTVTFTLNLIKNKYPFHDDTNVYHTGTEQGHSWDEFVGRRVIIRLSYWTEGFSNASYRIRYRSGTTDGHFSAFGSSYLSISTNGWRTIEAETTVKLASDGKPDVLALLDIRIDANSGSAARWASGTIWIDKVECILPDWDLGIPPMRTTAPINFLVYNFMPEHWTYYLTAPLPEVIVGHTIPVMYPLKERFGSRITLGLYTQPAEVPVRVDRQGRDYEGNWNSPARTTPSLCREIYGCYRYRFEQPDWLVKRHPPRNTSDPTDVRNFIVESRYKDYYLKLDRKDVLWAAMGGYARLARDFPFIDLFFLDNFLTVPTAAGDHPFDSDNRNQTPEPPYNDATTVYGHWRQFMGELSPYIRKVLGKKISGNIGSKAGLLTVGGCPGLDMIPYMDAFLFESPIVSFDYSTRTFSFRPYSVFPDSCTSRSWKLTFRAIRDNPNTDFHLIMYWQSPLKGAGDPSRQHLRYNLATYWLLYRPNLYLCLEDRRYTGDVDEYTHLYTIRQPEVWIPLGEPVEDYRIVVGDFDNGGLFMRRYQNGVVLVNPTESDINNAYITDRDYKDWDGNIVPMGTRISVPRKTGIVLYAAPEVKFRVLTQQNEDNRNLTSGGSSWDFVLECRNVGLMPAKNFSLEIPVLSGMKATLVGGRSRTTIGSGSVKFVIPELLPGQVKRFTVRVRVLGRSGQGANANVKILPMVGVPDVNDNNSLIATIFRNGQTSRLRFRIKNISSSQSVYNIEFFVYVPDGGYATVEGKSVMTRGAVSFVLSDVPSDPLRSQVRFPWILRF
jgi:hypothetical protein